jgi:LPXTG-motif cell wall-anchored protein
VPTDEPSASPSPEAEEPPVLAATGATVGGAIAFAALLVAGGIALFWARRRMQNA